MLIKKLKTGTQNRSTGPSKSTKNMSTQLDDQPFDDAFFQQNLPQYYRAILRDFKKITRSFVTFNLIFLSLFITELFLFFLALPFLTKSAIFAFSLGGIFLTCFSYFVLLFYHQAKKPEQLIHLRDQFLQSCRQILSVPQGEPQHHLSIADALLKLAGYLQDFELKMYQVPRVLKPVTNLIARFSAYSYRDDVFQMKQLLLQGAVDEHLKQIRITPTDLEVHASLAATYVALARIYTKKEQTEEFRISSKLAIEEFSILSHYAPNDPWVHEQLATGYHDLGMPEEEMREVETLLNLRSQDKEILFRLGSLYFKQGMNAKGLQIYENLKKANFKKAEDLISSYGSL